MKVVKTVAGFVPFLVFGALAPQLGAAGAAGAGALAAGVVVAATLRGGLQAIPVVQGVALLVMAGTALAGGPGLGAAVDRYGPPTATLVLGAFMLVTATRYPFTAQTARQSVPRDWWYRPRFLRVNRRISIAWGLAVAFFGVCSLTTATLLPPADGSAGGGGTAALLVRVGANWVLPVAGFSLAAVYTRRTSAAARSRATNGATASAVPTAPKRAMGAQ